MYVTQSLKRAVQVNANGIATIDQTGRQTWAEFMNRVGRLAGALQGLGLEADGRVAILSMNSTRYLEYYYAVIWAGGIIVPLNIRLAPAELIFMLNDSETSILIVDGTFQAMLPAFEGKLTSVKHIIVASDGLGLAGTLAYEDLMQAAPVPDCERGGSDVAGICYTGGTTGLPKGVMLSHDNLVTNAMNLGTVVKYDRNTVYLHTAPMFHAADSASNIIVTAFAGTHTFIPKFDPMDTLKAIQAYRVTHVTMVPIMINMLVNHPAVVDYDLSSLQRVLYGGSPMPQAVIATAKKVLPTVELVQAYGMTELSPVLTLLEDKYHTFEGQFAGKANSGGQVVFNMEAKIVDFHDNEVPRGTVGEVVARGSIVMQGYWKRPKETAEALRGGWMHTGDAGYMDEDGFIFISDRVKDMIISGGENVYSVEVENAIYQHPAVSMCAVIGIPDDHWGEAVHAIVNPKQGQRVTAEEVIAHCKTLIAGYKCPRSVEISETPLPLSGAGKILKANLRAPYWAGRERNVN